MLDLSSPLTAVAPNATPWHACGVQPVPTGSYILVDRIALLSAVTPGLISPVLVLPRVEDSGQMQPRLDVKTQR